VRLLFVPDIRPDIRLDMKVNDPNLSSLAATDLADADGAEHRRWTERSTEFNERRRRIERRYPSL